MQGQNWGLARISAEWYGDAPGGGGGVERAGAFYRGGEEAVLVQAWKLEADIFTLLLALFSLDVAF